MEDRDDDAFENRFRGFLCWSDRFSLSQPALLAICVNKYFHLSCHLLYEVLILLSKTDQFHFMTWLNSTNICHRICIAAFHFVYIFFSLPWMVNSPIHRVYLTCIFIAYIYMKCHIIGSQYMLLNFNCTI